MRCASCGRDLPLDSFSCPWCENGIQPSTTGVKPDRKPRNKALFGLLGACLGVFSVFAANWLWYFLKNNIGELTGRQASAVAGKTVHYYNEEYEISIDYPAGFVQRREKDTILAAYNARKDQGIVLIASTFDVLSFSEMSEKEMAHFQEMYGKSTLLSAITDIDIERFDKDSISSAYKRINGYKFLQVRFEVSDHRKTYCYYLYMGIYDNKFMSISLFAPAGDSSAMSELLASVDTFRFGKDAVP